MHSSTILICSMAVSLVACVHPQHDAWLEDPTADATAQRGFAEGSPEGVGLLAFLNEETTTLEVLDDDAALDRRAATHLVDHRLGEDGLWGTRDDNAFDSVEEVDGVYWVGPSTLARLVQYAETAGYVPTGSDALGVYDGVAFTVTEAEQTVDFVNTASENVLDNEVPLDRRAVDSILDSGELSTVLELSELYFVGHSALTRLKDYALASTETVEFQDQFNHDEELDIPDNDSTGIDARVHVLGVPSIEVEITVVADFQHDAPEELELLLTAPTGEEYNLTNGLSTVSEEVAYSDDPNGYWTLTVTDTATGNEGTLWGWALEINNAS